MREFHAWLCSFWGEDLNIETGVKSAGGHRPSLHHRLHGLHFRGRGACRGHLLNGIVPVWHCATGRSLGQRRGYFELPKVHGGSDCAVARVGASAAN